MLLELGEEGGRIVVADTKNMKLTYNANVYIETLLVIV